MRHFEGAEVQSAEDAFKAYLVLVNLKYELRPHFLHDSKVAP